MGSKNLVRARPVVGAGRAQCSPLCSCGFLDNSCGRTKSGQTSLAAPGSKIVLLEPSGGNSVCGRWWLLHHRTDAKASGALRHNEAGTWCCGRGDKNAHAVQWEAV